MTGTVICGPGEGGGMYLAAGEMFGRGLKDRGLGPSPPPEAKSDSWLSRRV